MALGPLPTVEHVVRVRLNGTNQTTPWVALFFWHYLGAAPTATALTSLCSGFCDAFRTTLVPSFATGVSIQNATAWDLASPAGATATGGTTATGTRVGTALPTSVAACVGWKVDYRWRGGHPRTYWPAGVTSDVLQGHLWVESARAAFEAGNEGFLTAANALTLGGTGGYLTAVRYVHTVYELDGTKHVEYLDPPLDLAYRRAVVDDRLDTQRRRLGPDL